jgi:flagellar biogenesis protein FliO
MEYFQQFVAVAGVFAALGALLWWLRRRGWTGSGWAASLPRRRRELECVERLSLGPQHSLHLVRAGGRLMLVASSPGGCVLIGHLPEPVGLRAEGQ